MHVLFDCDGRPFILNSQMRWLKEPNAFLARVSLLSGRTSSVSTWRSYAYELADWLSFTERLGIQWTDATEAHISTYRNILASESSPHTGRPLRRSTINHKLGVIAQFYRFGQKKGWIERLPFEVEAGRLSHRATGMIPSSTRPGCSVMKNSLTLTEPEEELWIPPRHEIRRFIKSFRMWRDQLVAEIMWLTGMRCAEVCELPLHALPENPSSIDKEAVAVRIMGKGRKRRFVLFPMRLLRSIDRYVHMERPRHVKGNGESLHSVFLGRRGKVMATAAVTRVFSTNCKRTGLNIWPHLLRHSYAVERLAYLQEIGAPNPLKTVQMELGHAHMSTTERYLHITERMRTELLEGHNSFVDRLLEE